MLGIKTACSTCREFLCTHRHHGSGQSEGFEPTEQNLLQANTKRGRMNDNVKACFDTLFDHTCELATPSKLASGLVKVDTAWQA